MDNQMIKKIALALAAFLFGAVAFTTTGAIGAFNPAVVNIPAAVDVYRVTASVASVLYQGYVDITWMGASASGSASNNATAIQAAIDTGRRVYIPCGTFNFATKLNIPTSSSFGGENQECSILMPSSAVATAALDVDGTDSLLNDFSLDGSNKSGIIGIRLSNTIISSQATMRNIKVRDFVGSGGKAMQIVNLVRGAFYDLYLTDSTQNLDIGSTVSGNYPTELAFYNLVAHSSTGGPGINIVNGFELWFYNLTSEDNYQAGVNIAPPAGRSMNGIYFLYGHMEGNWQSAASGAARNAEFNIDADGTGAGSILQNVGITGTYFNGSSSEASAARFNKVYNIRLDGPLVQQLAAAVVINNAASTGWISGLQGYATVLTDNSTAGNVTEQDAINENLLGAWTAYTPTYASSSGNAATTFSGAVTTTLARYKLVGKTLYVQINYTGTLNAVTPTYISVTLPASATAQSSNQAFPVSILNDTTLETGIGRTNSTVLRFARANDVAYGSGVAVSGKINAVVEVN